ncbi:MAG: hypothetical protein ACI4PC_05240 [Oscillospiraceae bacterium]
MNTERQIETVWLNEKERIASFHAVEGYTRRDFFAHELFLDFLRSLREKNYRFQ